MIYITLKKYKKIIISIIFILIIIFLYFKNMKEHLTFNNESILNIEKIFADVSGVVTFNNLKVNNLTAKEIDMSNLIKIEGSNINVTGIDNLNINQLNVLNDLDISGTLNMIKEYYTCTINGTVNVGVINQNMIPNTMFSKHMNILSNSWWVNREINSITSDKNNTILPNFTDGKIYGFNKDKIYKLDASINLNMNLETSVIYNFWVGRWINSDSTELTNIYVISEFSKNVTLNIITFASGSDNYTLTLQRYGNSTNTNNTIYASISISITEL